MKFFAVATLVSALPAILALRIETPSNAVQCQPLLLTWSDGTAPYFVSIIPGSQPSAPALKTFSTQNGNSLTWIVDIARGTSLTLSLKDSTGTQAYSEAFVINDSSDSKCVNADVQVSGSGGAGGAPTAGNTDPAPAPTGASTTGSSTGSHTGSSTGSTKPTGSSSGTAPSSSNAASRSTVGAFGLAGVMGLVGAALF